MVHQQTEPSDRERLARLFDVKATDRGASITLEGKTFITLNFNQPGLPAGFADRVLTHLFDLLVYRRTALWDEQTTNGPHALHPDMSRRRGNAHARLEEALRDKTIARGTKP